MQFGLFEIGIGGAAVLAIGWLVVSFSNPSPKRTVVEWVAALGMYVALSSLFVNLVRNAWEADNTVALVAFGFLTLLFGSGTLVTLYNVFTASRESNAPQSSTTN